tara:strand:- start:53 stop:391 length:339 start_codon:yes stop_codon:yes gene_type:complete
MRTVDVEAAAASVLLVAEDTVASAAPVWGAAAAPPPPLAARGPVASMVGLLRALVFFVLSRFAGPGFAAWAKEKFFPRARLQTLVAREMLSVRVGWRLGFQSDALFSQSTQI